MKHDSAKPAEQSKTLGLVDILRMLPMEELQSLAARVHARIDTSKRVDAPMQVARVLVGLPEIRQPKAMSSGAAQLVRRIAEAGGVLTASVVPPTIQPLAARGIVFARANGLGGFELIMPAAYLVQLPTWEGEDRRCMRALLSQAPAETLVAIASHYLGRPASYPVVLGLEEVWGVLGDRAQLQQQVASLALPERRLLEAICEQGGEVLTEELLDLEREPLRLRSATGASPSRRGVGFSLERRAMLLPVKPDRHVVPSEIVAIVCAKDVAVRQGRRTQIRAAVQRDGYEPRRARFATNPVPLVLAMTMALRDNSVEVRDNAGTPRSLVTRFAQRFGRDSHVVALLGALSRALGLWDLTGINGATPPGVLTLTKLCSALFRMWRDGGAWDEARAEPETLRLPEEARDVSPLHIVRQIVLDALEDLGESCWVPCNILVDYVQHDERMRGAASALTRWAKRVSVPVASPTDLVQTIVLQSLVALGVIDVGDDESLGGGEQDSASPDMRATLVRMTPLGRRLLNPADDLEPADDVGCSSFVDDTVLRVGTEATVNSVLSVQPFVEVGRVDDHLELHVTASAVARAVAAGIEGDWMRTNLSVFGTLPSAVSRIFDQVTVVVGRAQLVSCSGFLWCDDVDVRELLRSRKQTAELFVDPSPPGGLLLTADASIETVVRRCRALGVEIVHEGEVLRTSSTSISAVMEAVGTSGSRTTRRTDRPKRQSSQRVPARGG